MKGIMYWDPEAEKFIGVVPSEEGTDVGFIVAADERNPIVVRLSAEDAKDFIKDVQRTLEQAKKVER